MARSAACLRLRASISSVELPVPPGRISATGTGAPASIAGARPDGIGSQAAKARVALFKGGLILLAACVVAAQILWKLQSPPLPLFEIMGSFSLLGLAANSLCLFLLWRHRHEDVNMSSVWECSRNDIISNLSVFVAAGAVWLTGSGWADIAVATGLVIVLIRSALRVITAARAELRSSPKPAKDSQHVD